MNFLKTTVRFIRFIVTKPLALLSILAGLWFLYVGIVGILRNGF